MKYIKFLVVPLLFVTLAFMNIGGCGSSGGGSDSGCCIVEEDVCFDNTNQTECDFLGGDLEKGRSCNSFPICGSPPPTNPPPTNPPPTNPPPTNPPPTQPPSQCQVPALDTDFSDMLFLFIDELHNTLIGVTSNGTDVTIELTAPDIDPRTLGILAMTSDPDNAIINTVTLEGISAPATGDAVRVDNGSVFRINDLSAIGIVAPFDPEGECDSVEPIVTSSTETLKNVMLDLKTRGVLEDDGSRDLSNLITNFADELLPPQE